MAQYPEPIRRLIEAFKRLPGVGSRSAERFAYHVLNAPLEEAVDMSEAVREVKTKIKKCRECLNLSDSETCPICSDPSRSRDVICVVSGHEAAAAIEKTGSYRGLYHIMWTHLSPLDGKGPEDIAAGRLISRVKKLDVKEVILALDPTLEGDATTLYLLEQMKTLKVKATRPARGISSGSGLARANITVLTDALEGRSRI